MDEQTTETTTTKRTHGPRRSYAERMAEVRAAASARLVKLQDKRARKMAEVEAIDAEIEAVTAEVGAATQPSLYLGL
jgi:hypothetical protein